MENLNQTETEQEELQANPAETEAQKGSEKETEPTKETQDPKTAPKLFPEEEVNKRIASVKGGYEGTVGKLKGDIKTLRAEIAKLTDLSEERETSNWLKAVEDSGGDIDVAKQVVTLRKSLRTKEVELSQKAAELEERAQLLNEAGRTKTATDFVKQYELGEDALEELLKAEDMTAMENKALKLAFGKKKVEAKTSESPVKPTNVKSGLDISKMSIERRLGLAIEGKI